MLIFSFVKKSTLHQLLPLFSTFSVSEKQNRKERERWMILKKKKNSFHDVETLAGHMLIVRFMKKTMLHQLLPNILMFSVSE